MVGRHIATMIGFAGTSIAFSPTGYRGMLMADLPERYKRTAFAFKNVSGSGYATWSNLVLFSGLVGCELVILETVNDELLDMAHIEAFIRKVWAMGAAIICIVFFAVASNLVNDNVNHPTNQASLTPYLAMLSYYNIATVDFWGDCQGWVNGGLYDLSDLLGDTVHPSETGHKLTCSKARRYLPFKGTFPPARLPARLYAASADFEQDPLVKDGVDYDSRTGTWVDAGLYTSSNVPGSTITFSGVFRSFGCIPNNTAVDVVVDGVPHANIPFYQNGWDIGVRAVHTVEITVLTTVDIDQFWAI